MSNPGKGHWEALKWLLRHLKGTSNVCLKFGRNSSGLIGYCDSDYAGDLDARKSTSGNAFTLGGIAVSWQSSLQDVVAMYTTEAEYIAIAESFKEAKWLKGLVGELCPEMSLVRIHSDSDRCHSLGKESKHFSSKNQAHRSLNIISFEMKLSIRECA